MIQQSHFRVKYGENHNSKRYMHPKIHHNTIYNSQDMEATKMSINRGMDKENVAYIQWNITQS